MTTEELGKRLLDHAMWMSSSGQFIGTLDEYLGFHRGRGAGWEEAMRLAEQNSRAVLGLDGEDAPRADGEGGG